MVQVSLQPPPDYDHPRLRPGPRHCWHTSCAPAAWAAFQPFQNGLLQTGPNGNERIWLMAFNPEGNLFAILDLRIRQVLRGRRWC